MENNKQNLTGFAIILGLSIIISFGIVSYTFYSSRTNNTISVVGSATKEVTSDQVKWSSNITRTVRLSKIKDGYAEMANDLKEVQNFLTTNGIADKDTTISPIFMNEVYEQNQPVDKSYNLVQTVTVQSSDVQKITDLSKTAGTLVVTKGILFSTSSLEYYYSKLPDMRINLLPDAIADAKARAEKLAEAGGKKVGTLNSASNGVVQVLSTNSVDVSDYGTYDTSQIQKDIMVTVKANFNVN